MVVLSVGAFQVFSSLGEENRIANAGSASKFGLLAELHRGLLAAAFETQRSRRSRGNAERNNHVAVSHAPAGTGPNGVRISASPPPSFAWGRSQARRSAETAGGGSLPKRARPHHEKPPPEASLNAGFDLPQAKEVVQFSGCMAGRVASKQSDLRIAWYFAQNVRSINSMSNTEVVMNIPDVETIKKTVQAISYAAYRYSLAGNR